ncbi:MAG: MFS transporter [Pseudomonadota bacterium]
MTKRPAHILPVIVISQFAGTSLWFAGNAVIPDLQKSWGLSADALGYITSSVQLGFITGTLVFAFFAISDRVSPRKLFLACSFLGALSTVATTLTPSEFSFLVVLRFATGFFLAGIYPVGMKIASGWFDRDLGRALGYLVGALVVGTALPHLIRGVGQTLPWEYVMVTVSLIAAIGGVIMYMSVPDGPFLKAGAPFDPKAFLVIFGSKRFRASSFGYFGHMWELYTVWVFMPALVLLYLATHDKTGWNVPFLSFCIIAIGGLSCVVSGLVALKRGSAPVAFYHLLISGLCCLIAPLMIFTPPVIFVLYLLVWGITVIGDSAQYSTMNAKYAPPELVGSALTYVNAIGFGLSVVSIQLVSYAVEAIGVQNAFLLLLPGPLFGLWALMPLMGREGDRQGEGAL